MWHRNSSEINEPPQFNRGEIITLNQAIALIKQSVGDEKEDEMFYSTLIEQAPTDKEKDIIKSIRNDERKHNQILRELKEDAFLMLEVRTMGVHSWKEVQVNELCIMF